MAFDYEYRYGSMAAHDFSHTRSIDPFEEWRGTDKGDGSSTSSLQLFDFSTIILIFVTVGRISNPRISSTS